MHAINVPLLLWINYFITRIITDFLHHECYYEFYNRNNIHSYTSILSNTEINYEPFYNFVLRMKKRVQIQTITTIIPQSAIHNGSSC